MAGAPGCAVAAASLCAASVQSSTRITVMSTFSLSLRYSTFSFSRASSSKGTLASRADAPNCTASSRLKAANGPTCLDTGFSEASCMSSCMTAFHCAFARSSFCSSSWEMSGNSPSDSLARIFARTLSFHSGYSFATYTVEETALPGGLLDFSAFSWSLMKSCGTFSYMYLPWATSAGSTAAVGVGQRASSTEPALPRRPHPCSQKCGVMGERMIICHSRYLRVRALFGRIFPDLQMSRY
mmetsp:Transcript_91457/g.238313  ORF Transcript_91457/g.238313 Transcript_91457/m.238313 type:complete len:240 (+) Transcript_91457:437-1156(+)